MIKRGLGAAPAARASAGFVAAALWTVSAGATGAMGAPVTVNDDLAGPGPAGASCGAPDFGSIQAALNAAGGGGDIAVCAGTYPESLDVTADHVTIRGVQAGTDPRSGAPATVSELDLPDAAGVGVDVDADDFRMNGMTVTDSTGTAIRLTGGAGHTLVNNVISEAAAGAFLVGDDGGTDLIRHNFFDSNSRAPGLGDGIQTSGVYAADLVIDENDFRGHDSAAIVLQSATGGADVTGNATDGDATFFVGQGVVGGLVAGNSVAGAAGTAIFLASGNSGLVIRGNSIGGLASGPASSSGIRLSAAFGAAPANEDVDILGNAITGRSAAIRIDDAMYTGALDVRFNRIAGNGIGIRDDDSSVAHTVDAADNWWGCNEGAGAAGCDTIDGTAATSVEADPHLVFGLTAPSSVFTGATAAVRATLERNSAGDAPAPNLTPPTPVAFATTLGTVAPSATTAGGVATAGFAAGETPGTATFTATLDGASATAQTRILSRPGPPQGTPGDDDLFGTGGDDSILGGAGNDVINGAGGDDELDGGTGDDELRGAGGDDRVIGGPGTDELHGGHGSDRLEGGEGGDELKGGLGADVLDARDGDVDVVFCGRGRDRVRADRFDRLRRGCRGRRGHGHG